MPHLVFVAEYSINQPSARPKPSAAKISRRLSARVGEFFKVKPKEPKEATPAKVDENPPKIDAPAPVAPLENPADAEAAAPAAEAKAEAPTEETAPEAPKPVEAAPSPPIVAAAA